MTVEIAVALPALVFVMAVALWGVGIASLQVASVDAVRAGARAAARGEQLSAVRAEVLRAAPKGAEVDVVRHPITTTVALRVAVKPPVLGALPTVVLREKATAATEPGAGVP